jgi:hypothetical protein
LKGKLSGIGKRDIRVLLLQGSSRHSEQRKELMDKNREAGGVCYH